CRAGRTGGPRPGDLRQRRRRRGRREQDPGHPGRPLSRHVLRRTGRRARRHERARARRPRHRPRAGRSRGAGVPRCDLFERGAARAPPEQGEGARGPRRVVPRARHPMNPLFDTLPQPLRGDVERASASWDEARSTSRIWARDASVWTGSGEEQWLGWLDAPDAAAASLPDLQEFAAEVQRDGFTDVLLLGMGGSSLCPEVLAESFSPHAGRPRLHVLDSTDPDQIRAVESRLDLARTLVIVASKSGTTLEPSILQAHFTARLAAVVGEANAGRHLVAITDPGSPLEQAAARDGFRRVFRGVPSIGGRYSALSPFGLVPAAVMGLELPRWI